MAKDTKVKDSKPDVKSPSSNSKNASNKKSHIKTPVIIAGVFIIVVLAATVLLYFISKSDTADVTYEEEQVQLEEDINYSYYSDQQEGSEEGSTTEEAVSDWQEVADSRTDINQKADAYYQQGIIYLQGQQPEQAIEVFNRMLEQDSDFSRYTIYDALAAAAVMMNDNELAIVYYNETLKYFEIEYGFTEDYEVVRDDYLELIEELK